jgi:hypothetical protein
MQSHRHNLCCSVHTYTEFSCYQLLVLIKSGPGRSETTSNRRSREAAIVVTLYLIMDREPDIESVRKKRGGGAGITEAYRVIVSPVTSSLNGVGPRLKNSGLKYGINM